MKSRFKKYERPSTLNGRGVILMGYDVDLDRSELLLDVPTFTQERFDELFEVKSGSWSVKDGWAEGKNPEMCPGMIISRADHFGNVMVEIVAKLVEPCTHDIDLMVNGSWDEEKNQRGCAYVAGLEGFYHGCVGIEKSPDYGLNAITILFPFEPEREYKVALGNIDGHVFVLVDDRVCLEVTDPEPLDTQKYGKIGFEAFASWWRFKDLKVYQLAYTPVNEYYLKEF